MEWRSECGFPSAPKQQATDIDILAVDGGRVNREGDSHRAAAGTSRRARRRKTSSAPASRNGAVSASESGQGGGVRPVWSGGSSQPVVSLISSEHRPSQIGGGQGRAEGLVVLLRQASVRWRVLGVLKNEAIGHGLHARNDRAR